MGRRKKKGEREPGGRLSRKPEHVAIQERRTKATVMRQRVNHLGVTMKNADNPVLADVVGVLFYTKEIDANQYEAAKKYREDVDSFKRSIDAPREAKAVNFNSAPGLSTHDPDIQERKDIELQRRLKGAQSAILGVNGGWQSDVNKALASVVLEDESHPYLIGDVRIGLNALAKYYGVST